MKITLIEPFYTGSHRRWAEELQQYSSHDIDIKSLSGHHWKWRMHGGAITLGRKCKVEKALEETDLILATDMLDLTTFLAHTRKSSHDIPVVLYMHENQLTYPWSATDQDVQKKRDNHYAFINYNSMLAADEVWFNSQYHLDSYFSELPNFLNQFPDHNEMFSIERLKDRSKVVGLGLDLRKFDKYQTESKNMLPIILWNHRWEYDKNPEGFFRTLYKLSEDGLDFQLVALGESFEKYPEVFDEAKEKLKDHILHFGYAESFDDYARWLHRANLLPVTSNQDFFGISVVEAMYCDVMPLLPNRLVYPEHIPEDLKSNLLVEDEFDMLGRMKQLLRNWPQDFRSLKETVQKWDWGTRIKEYDQLLSSAARS